MALREALNDSDTSMVMDCPTPTSASHSARPSQQARPRDPHPHSRAAVVVWSAEQNRLHRAGEFVGARSVSTQPGRGLERRRKRKINQMTFPPQDTSVVLGEKL